MLHLLRSGEVPKPSSIDALPAVAPEAVSQVTLVRGENDWSLVMRLLDLQMDRKSNGVSGGDNNLAVVVKSSDNANVQCMGGPAPAYVPCNTVAHTMLASMKRQTFGSIGDPTVDNHLPHDFASCKSGLGTCYAELINDSPKHALRSVLPGYQFLRQRRRLRHGTWCGRQSTQLRRCAFGTTGLEKFPESVSQLLYLIERFRKLMLLGDQGRIDVNVGH